MYSVLIPLPLYPFLVNSIEVREIGGRKVVVFDQLLDEDTSVATILIRASTEHVLNDIERALEDGIYAYKALIEDNRYVCMGLGMGY